MIALRPRLPRFARKLASDTRGVALIEFAYTVPVLALLGLYGIESANLALANMRVSQIAMNVADTASRVGESNGLGLKVIRESDINDAFKAAAFQQGKMEILTRGRIILSSLEQNATGGQWVRWQRCTGSRTSFVSTNGNLNQGQSGNGFAGMGKAGQEVQAPAGSAVMFVEVAYDYKPLVSSRIFGTKTIRNTAAFLVRDGRDLSVASNPKADATKSLC